MEASRSPTSSTAASPFDKADADVIVRTSDMVDFHVFMVILRFASRFFEDMFSLPQPVHPEDHCEQSSRVPIIPVTEDSATLDCLLRLCYPIPDPVIGDAAQMGAALEAAMKYQMEQATNLLKQQFGQITAASPVRAYAVACLFNLEHEARLAARATVSIQCIQYDAEMDKIPAGAFHRLLEYRRIGGPTDDRDFCRPIRANPAIPPSIDELRSFEGWQSHPDRGVSGETAPSPRALLSPSQSVNLPPADMIVLSSDAVQFHVHRTLLTYSSPVFADLIGETTATLQLDATSQDIPTVALEERSDNLSRLLLCCYFSGDPELGDFQVAIDILKSATKYKLARAMQAAKRRVMDHLDMDPVRVYFAASQYGWEEEAQVAARHAIYEREDSYCPEMEEVSAAKYHRLLVYRQKCIDIIRGRWGYLSLSIQPYEWGNRGRISNNQQSFSHFFQGHRIKTPEQPRSTALIAIPVIQRYTGNMDGIITESMTFYDAVQEDIAQIVF
ncbi:uncharacterized protein LAESUDRAFT_749542 [Laetiporus sulphureus 93-53]|uniref:BTB domain-containing protein n=1 Tax=Laetiporus sulphureus 93-53 TaxID=1314785 RepID=A0A165EK23_9APHY|nr:uncharacterized protein LAESUDRAFT_749542 [Laetiporus sulphureus 93-53]KZT07216.1 hypothetical protein LAESUDRAFT_749542 [Laetiporus sulphureus 93-53]